MLNVFEHAVGNRLGGSFIGRRADPEPDTFAMASVITLFMPALRGSFPDSMRETKISVFLFVEILYKRVQLVLRQIREKAFLLKVVSHPFLAAGNLKELVIPFLIPRKIVPKGFESLVESDPVPVLFGVDDDAVLIEKYCTKVSHRFLLPP
jgi:hypothetical protein